MSANSKQADENHDAQLARWGYLILVATYFLFLATLNSFFQLWSYVIHPLESVMPQVHARLSWYFGMLDSLVLKLWCIYVVVWIWSVVSWTGLTLFSHSKGIQNLKS